MWQAAVLCKQPEYSPSHRQETKADMFDKSMFCKVCTGCRWRAVSPLTLDGYRKAFDEARAGTDMAHIASALTNGAELEVNFGKSLQVLAVPAVYICVTEIPHILQIYSMSDACQSNEGVRAMHLSVLVSVLTSQSTLLQHTVNTHCVTHLTQLYCMHLGLIAHTLFAV